MPDQSWFGLVIDRLIYLRATEGPDFPRHWAIATKLYPPPRREWTGRLFSDSSERHDTLLAFQRRVAESAYYNERGMPGSGVGPALGYFRPWMLREMDESRPARAGRVSRAFRSAA